LTVENNPKKGIYYLIPKLVLSTFSVYFVQQVVHEFGHAITVLMLGGKIEGFDFSISGASVTSIVPDIPLIIMTVNFSGGIIASLFLLILYLCTKKFWVEFNIMTFTFLLMNLIIAFIEGFLNVLYVQNLKLWSYLCMPCFLLSVILFKRRLFSQYRSTLSSQNLTSGKCLVILGCVLLALFLFSPFYSHVYGNYTNATSILFMYSQAV
jgi:hypothetical protein